MKDINVTVNGTVLNIKQGTTIEKLIESGLIKDKPDYAVTLGLVNNNLRELGYILFDDCVLELIDITDPDGRRTYMRSLTFLFMRALEELYPQATAKIQHSLSHGIFCDIYYEKKFTTSDAQAIEKRIREFVKNDEKIVRFKVSKEEAIKIYNRQRREEKADLLKYKDADTVHLYRCGDLEDYFYGYMVPSASKLQIFSVRLYNDGIVLLGPDINKPSVISAFKHQPKLFKIYKEAKEWADIIEIPNAAALNEAIKSGSYPEIIRLVEAYHEKKVCEISDMIQSDAEKGRIILIAGPSSSGKTSFAQRLKLQLMVNKLKPVSISIDNYFLNRDVTPVDEYGQKDFESIYAIDLELFNKHLEMLISGYEVDIPVYNFKTGQREYKENRIISIKENQPIIIEGIHGLNPLLTESIPEGNKFKIYISALTQLNLDDHNKIPTTDLRLIRRMVRDYNYRSYSAEQTMSMWASVNRGERKNIFPFQENADIMFNSALVYELSVLKKYVIPILNEVPQTSLYHKEAKRLLKFLQYFVVIDDESDIINISLIREFIGGSKLV